MGLTKTCLKCGKELSFGNFGNDKRHKDGLIETCKGCISEYNRARRLGNREKYAAATRAWQKANPEKAKAWHKANPERTNAAHKKWYEANLGKIKTTRRARYLANTEKEKAAVKVWREANLEKYNIAHKAWNEANPEKTKQYVHRRRAAKRSLLSTLTVTQWEDIKQHFDKACCYCGKEELLHQEHFLALSKGGEYSHDNIVPSCQSCNSSKGSKDFFDWYPKFKHYSKKREKVILEYLNYDKRNNQQLSIL